jgi:preprotein translocase subunit SecE
VADKNRGGRSADDDSIDEPVEDAYDDDADLDEADFDEDEQDEAPKSKDKRGSGAAATATRTRATVKDDDARPGIFGRLVRRFRETVAELQKVIWPTRKELLTYTTVVIIFVAIVMSYVAGLDLGFARLMLLIFGSTDDAAAASS